MYGKVDEMSPAPLPNPLPSPTPNPHWTPLPPCWTPLLDKEDKEESMTLPARDFALQLP